MVASCRCQQPVTGFVHRATGAAGLYPAACLLDADPGLHPRLRLVQAVAALALVNTLVKRVVMEFGPCPTRCNMHQAGCVQRLPLPPAAAAAAAVYGPFAPVSCAACIIGRQQHSESAYHKAAWQSGPHPPISRLSAPHTRSCSHLSHPTGMEHGSKTRKAAVHQELENKLPLPKFKCLPSHLSLLQLLCQCRCPSCFRLLIS